MILDADLAALYGVTTKALNQAVKRNAGRFPEDFLFRLVRELLAANSVLACKLDELQKKYQHHGSWNAQHA